jgi:hypothetical protein
VKSRKIKKSASSETEASFRKLKLEKYSSQQKLDQCVVLKSLIVEMEQIISITK